MYKTLNHLYTFGPFTLDPGERQLRKGATRMDIPPRAFDTLLVLVSNSGRLLEKDDLMRTVWGDTIVEESNLSQVVYLLRKALHGKNGEHYIETVPKRGYRFIAAVHEIEAEGDGCDNNQPDPVPDSLNSRPVTSSATILSPVEPPFRPANIHSDIDLISAAPRLTHQEELPIRGRNRGLGVLAISAALLLLTATAWKEGLFATVPRPIRSIAVLPMQNLSNDPNQEYFVDGMTDELITDLAQIRPLKVVSKTSVMQYKGTRTPLPKIGRDLKVDAVVEGSVLRSGDHVRITAQLIRTATDRHIWAASYDGDLKDVFSLQARVAAAITDEIKLNLTTEESGRLRAGKSTDPEAFDLYLRGRYAWNQRNPESFKAAVDFFSQAIERDPNFALAYSGLADSRTLLVLYGDNPAHLSDAKDAAEKALTLDPTLAEAHTSLAAVRILHDWDWQGAEREFQQAIELNPNYAQAHHWYGNLLLGPEGRHNEAIAELQRAQELDPLSLIVSADIGFAYYLAGKNDLALQTYQKVLAVNPNFVPAHYYLAKYYQQTGVYDLWLKEIVADDQLAGSFAQADFIQQYYARGGFPAVMDAIAASNPSINSIHNRGVRFDACAMSQANLWLGRNATALDELENCYRSAAQITLTYLKVDPGWSKLHSEPRYQDILRRIGLN